MEGESRPLICPECGSEMAVLAIITNPEAVHKILNHLRKNKSPPFDKKVTKASWPSFPYTLMEE
jgi:hypothetical protein